MAVKNTFFIRKLQEDIEEPDWLCSPGTSFAPLGELHGEGTRYRRTLRLLDRSSPRADLVKIKLCSNQKEVAQAFLPNGNLMFAIRSRMKGPSHGGLR